MRGIVSSAQSAVLAIVSRTAVTGKTTCAVNLAAAMAKRGLRTAVIDLDRGGFATGWLLDTHSRHLPTIREVLLETAEIHDALRPSRVPQVDVVPALPTLADVEQAWSRSEGWQRTLRRALEPLRSTHAIIILDCPPGVSHLAMGALVAATCFLMVAAPKPGKTADVPDELAAIAQAWEYSGSHAKLLGVQLNRLTGTLDSKMALFTDLQKRLGAAILPIPILEDQVILECQGKQITVFEHLHASGSAAKFNQLAEALMTRMCLEFPLRPTPESTSENHPGPSGSDGEQVEETQNGLKGTDKEDAEKSSPDEPPDLSETEAEHLERMRRAVEDIELETIEAKDITEFNPKADNPLPATPPKGGRLNPESEREMCKMAAEKLGMPIVSLDELEVTPELLETIPPDLMRRFEVFPIGVTEMGIRVAMANPFDDTAKEALERATDKRIFLCIAPESEVKRLIRRHAAR